MASTVTERLTETETLENQAAELDQERRAAEEEREIARKALVKARFDLNQYSSEHARYVGLEAKLIPKPVRFRLEELHEAFDAANERVDEIEARLAGIDEELQAVRAQYNAAMNGVTLKDLTTYQERLIDQHKEIARLVDIIEAQELIIGAVDASALEEARRRREAALADLAEGKATAKDVKAVEEACTEAEAAYRQARRDADTAESTVSGLHPRLTAAEERLTDLRNGFRQAIRMHLLTEAEAVGRDYLKLADRLTAAFLRLHGLSELSRKLCGTPLTSSYLKPLAIPVFSGLKAFETHAHRDYVIDSDSRKITEKLWAADKAEVERFEKAGLELDLLNDQVSEAELDEDAA